MAQARERRPQIQPTASRLSFAGTPLVVFTENLLLLRFAEYDGELHRLFCVLKMRFSDFDRTLHAYTILGGEGIRITGTAPRAEGLLTGMARPLNSALRPGSVWPAAQGGR